MGISPFQDTCMGIRCCPRGVCLSVAVGLAVYYIGDYAWLPPQCKWNLRRLGCYTAMIGSSSKGGSNRHFCCYIQTGSIGHCELCIERVHCANAFSMGDSHSSFTTKPCACTSVACLEGIFYFSVDFTQKTQTYIHAPCGIRTHNVSVRSVGDSTRRRPELWFPDQLQCLRSWCSHFTDCRSTSNTSVVTIPWAAAIIQVLRPTCPASQRTVLCHRFWNVGSM
jgi:hypothetical protein